MCGHHVNAGLRGMQRIVSEDADRTRRHLHLPFWDKKLAVVVRAAFAG